MRPVVTALFLFAGTASASAMDQVSAALDNPTAYIPPQCYTKTEDAAGAVHNPCQTCHTYSRAPHYINDADLQLSYAFPEPALDNPWTNLFVDRRAEIAATSDDDILSWVRTDNYFGENGTPLLQAKLATPPAGWDVDGDGTWSGYVPDTFFNFDADGFDHAPDGSLSGWRAFAYQPLPGTFWPTNGSTDDVLIRLPEAYRQDADGKPSTAIYKLNLAITEALIKRADITIEPTDETPLGVDLDRDGTLGTATRVGFAFAPLKGITMHWVGKAGTLSEDDAPLAAGLYPLGTEFLHTVRYLDVTDQGISMSARMKEVRYMKKSHWLTYFDRMDGALAEAKETSDFPDRLASFVGNAEIGIPNGTGWRLQGFIEDASGDLRPQSFEETVFCVGCHGGVGTNDDDTFAFPRKLDAGTAFQQGWYHWSQKGLAGTPDLARADGNTDYAHYLETNSAGDEFRANAEVIAAWLSDGTLSEAHAEDIASDISGLILPSPQRALALDTAYRMIVREQSFTKGRDASFAPLDDTVWRTVEQDQPTGVTEIAMPWYGHEVR